MHNKSTKIVATLGPSSSSEATIAELINSGVDVFRLNFSHGNIPEKKELIDKIRKVSNKLNSFVAIVADLPGPKLRLNEIDGILNIKKGDSVILGQGQNSLPVSYDLSKVVKPSHRIYLNDGLVELMATKIQKNKVHATALNSGWVSSRKGINLPDTNIPGGALEGDDIKFAKFAIDENVDFLALSFVQTANDIIKAKKFIESKKSSIKIMAKIEKPQAIYDLENIIRISDCVMVARGDLAIETSPSEVPIIQQKITSLCRHYQTPVIVATQMLESMIENPRPTRAEASDVANAVLSQVDAVMLSAETASGKYPVESVQTMNSIIQNVEGNQDFKRYIKLNWEKFNPETMRDNAIASSAASLAYRLKCKAIVVGTVTGKTAELLSSFRPSSKIIAVSHDPFISRQLALNWGVVPVYLGGERLRKNFTKTIKAKLLNQGIFQKGDLAVFVYGTKIGISGTTDTIKVDTV